MNKIPVGHILFSMVILFLQVLLLKNVQIPLLNRFSISIFLYPAIIVFLPIEVRRSVVIVGAFFLGLFIDLFYDSPGVHTAALVLTAFLRDIILRLIEPRQGYRGNQQLGMDAYGPSWFLSYLALTLFIHIVAYFSVDAFSLIFIVKILVNSILSFIGSYLILVMYKIMVR